MFSGMHVVPVSEGTEIECDGKKMIVTASNAVAKGQTFYATHAHLAALKDSKNVKSCSNAKPR